MSKQRVRGLEGVAHLCTHSKRCNYDVSFHLARVRAIDTRWSHPGVLFKALILLVKDYTQLYVHTRQINPNPTLINPTQTNQIRALKGTVRYYTIGEVFAGYTVYGIASFPGHSRLQFLIACSMQSTNSSSDKLCQCFGKLLATAWECRASPARAS